jgi:restriction endonuclease Mrr
MTRHGRDESEWLTRKRSIDPNRVHWAKTYLAQAKLLEITRRAHFRITDSGKKQEGRSARAAMAASTASLIRTPWALIEFTYRPRDTN